MIGVEKIVVKTAQAIALVRALGAIEGRVQPMPGPDPRHFLLYEAVRGEAVACSIAADCEEIMRDAWGRRVLVEGWVSREGETGRPVSITDVRTVTVIAEIEPGSLLRAARGIAPAVPGADPPEVVIRRLRDE